MISDTQLQLAINKSYNELLPKGSVPHPYVVMSNAMKRFIGVPKSYPTANLFMLNRKRKFDRQMFNKFMDSVGFDLEVAYSEIISWYQEAINSVLSRNLSLSYLRSKLNDNRKSIDAIQKSIAHQGYVRAFVDSFDNTNNINQTETTADTDSELGIATLAASQQHTNRISMRHLYKVFSPNLKLEGLPATAVLRNSPVEDHGFDNALIDTESSWLQSIVLDSYSGPISAILDIPLAENGSVDISLVELLPKRNNKSSIEVFTSADGQNFVRFGPASSSRDRSVSFHGSSTASILRIKFNKPNYDYAGDGKFEYVFGLKYLRVFNVVYSQNASIVSNAYTIDDNHSISKVTLEADEYIPQGTDIDYYIKVFGSEESEWSKICPANRNQEDGPKELLVGPSRNVSDSIIVNSGVIESNKNGMKFYNIGSIPDDRSLDYKSLSLYRGINAWRLGFDKNIAHKIAKDIYINFNYQTPDGKQRIYAYRSNDADIISSGKLLNDNTRPQAAIRVPHKINYNMASMTLTPTETSQHFVYEPNYAIASVRRHMAGQAAGYSTDNSEIRGNRMRFESSGQDTYLTKPQIKLLSNAISDVIDNSIPNASFTQTSITSHLQVYSYTDSSNPEQITVMEKSSDGSIIVAENRYKVLGTYSVTDNGAIKYPSTSEFIEENGHQILKVVDPTSTPELPSGQSSIVSDWAAFTAHFSSASSDIYVLYASLASNPTATLAASVSDGFILVPNFQHSQVDPTMFQDMNFPVSVYINTADGVIDDNFTATGVTKATISKTLTDGSTEIGYVDALIINRSGAKSSIPPIQSSNIKTWYILSSDITNYVERINNDIITFKTGLEFDYDDEVIVNYRAQFGDKLKVIEDSVVLKPEPGSSVVYQLDKDYRIDPDEGTISMVSSGAINRGNVGKVYLSMNYTEEFNDLYIYASWMHSPKSSTIDINRFGGYVSENASDSDKAAVNIDINYDSGEVIIIDNKQIDKSSSVDLEEGWHKIIIKTPDVSRAKKIMTAVDSEGSYIFFAGKYFDQARAYKDPLRYLSPDVFYDANRLGNPKYFTIESDNSIIISFNPGDNAITNNKLYKVYKGELTSGMFSGNLITNPENIPIIFEQFMIQYKYLPTVAGFAADVAVDASTYSTNGFLPATRNRYVIDKVYIKAELNRLNGQPANKTPVLFGYKLMAEG